MLLVRTCKDTLCPKPYMHNDAFNQLIHDDTCNTSLSHPLALWLNVKDLAVLAHVCRALRAWVVESGKAATLAKVKPLLKTEVGWCKLTCCNCHARRTYKYEPSPTVY